MLHGLRMEAGFRRTSTGAGGQVNSRHAHSYWHNTKISPWPLSCHRVAALLWKGRRLRVTCVNHFMQLQQQHRRHCALPSGRGHGGGLGRCPWAMRPLSSSYVQGPAMWGEGSPSHFGAALARCASTLPSAQRPLRANRCAQAPFRRPGCAAACAAAGLSNL